MAIAKREIEDRIQAFSEALRDGGLRLTPQRLEIFREIARTEAHPDVETVFHRVRVQVPTVSLDTVYRTLALLEKRGLIARVDALSGRARYDANTDRHHHFVCTECGLVGDVYDEALDQLPVPASVAEFGAVRSAQVQFRGLCSRCAAQKRRGTRGR